MKPAELNELLTVLRAHGVTRFTLDGQVSIELGPSPVLDAAPKPPANPHRDREDAAYGPRK